MSEPNRKWVYSIEDIEGVEFYVDENGEEVYSDDDARVHIATDAEAFRESGRRADLWERKNSTMALKAMRHSRGIEK